MGWKGMIRSHQASLRRQQRASHRRARELEREIAKMEREEAREAAKQAEFERAHSQVELYEATVKSLLTMHVHPYEAIDWNQMMSQAKPPEPQPGTEQETKARIAAEEYQPSFWAKIFGGAKRERARLLRLIEVAKEDDQRIYEEARMAYPSEVEAWEAEVDLATRIVGGNLQAYRVALEKAGAFEELHELGCTVELVEETLTETTGEVVVTAQQQRIVPGQKKSLTKTGKVSSKAMPMGEANEIYQDYVCGAALRVAIEAFSVLPLNRLLVHVRPENRQRKVCLSVVLERSTIAEAHFASGTVDASDFVESIELRAMQFGKRKGLTLEEPLPASTLAS